LTGVRHEQPDVSYRGSPAMDPEEMHNLFAAAWGDSGWDFGYFGPILRRSHVYICAARERNPVGFVSVAWAGADTVSSWTPRSTRICGGAVSEARRSARAVSEPTRSASSGGMWTSSRTCSVPTKAAVFGQLSRSPEARTETRRLVSSQPAQPVFSIPEETPEMVRSKVLSTVSRSGESSGSARSRRSRLTCT
jgi:hypothetical protein